MYKLYESSFGGKLPNFWLRFVEGLGSKSFCEADLRFLLLFLETEEHRRLIIVTTAFDSPSFRRRLMEGAMHACELGLSPKCGVGTVTENFCAARSAVGPNTILKWRLITPPTSTNSTTDKKW